MYLLFIIGISINYITSLSDCFLNPSLFDGILVFLKSVQVFALIVFCVKGHILSSQRDRFERTCPDRYHPDSYFLFIFGLYYVSACILSIIEFAFRRIESNNASDIIFELIGYIIGILLCVIPVLIVVKRKYEKSSVYDPTSSKYKSDTNVEDDKGELIPLFKNIWAKDSEDKNIIKMIKNPVGESTTFCVCAVDDSMVPSGILRGSLVYFADTSPLNKGDIVAALIGNQVVIRRATETEDHAFALEASNNAFPPMVFENAQQANIIGVATAIYMDMLK